MAKDQLVVIPERRGAVMRKCHQVGIESADDAVDGAVGRCFKAVGLGDAAEAAVKRGNGGPRLAERHALDQVHKVGRHLVRAGIGTGLTGQSDESALPVPR